MKFTQFFTRLLAIVFICGLMVFANVNPALAAQDQNNNKIKSQLPLPTIQKKAEEITKTNPYETNLEYTTENPAAQGLNEVQGTADFDKMKRSSDSVPAVVGDVEKVLDKVGDKVGSVKDDTQDTVDSAIDKAGDAANYVKDKAGDVVNSVTDKAGDAVNSIKNKVKS